MNQSAVRAVLVLLVLALPSLSVASVPGPAGASGVAELPLGGLTGDLDPASVLIGCDQAAVRVVITAPAHLDPDCIYTAGFDVVATDAVLDCRGARIESGAGSGRGVLIRTDAHTPLERVTVRNCIVGGFLNNVRVTRDGFKQLDPALADLNATADILIENSVLHDSAGSGIFVDGYVRDVTLQDLHITRSGSVGIYLEAGSHHHTVQRNHVVANGWKENGPDGQTFELAGQTFRWWGTGREGLAIDGSYDNVVRHNLFERNEAGAIFLYKNCGEFATERPEQHWTRVTPAARNLIEHNTIIEEQVGIWVGSRMAENQLFMDCSDPAYVSDALTRLHEDAAPDNVVRNNDLHDVQYGIRVEDDATFVGQNRFRGDDPSQLAVLVGTLHRTRQLGRPVRNTVLMANDAEITDSTHPYRWVHGTAQDTVEANTSSGRPVGWCEGVQPTINPFLFVVQFAPDTPGVGPATTAPPAAPPPCPDDTIDGEPTPAPAAFPPGAVVAEPRFAG